MGKWMKKILGPASQLEPEDHISLEDLATLAEGSLSKEDRERHIEHLNRCALCYEIFQETLKDLPAEQKSGSWNMKPLYALAASVIFVVMIGGGLFFKFHSTPPEMIVASLTLDADLRRVLMEGDTLRWEKKDRVARFASLLRTKGVKFDELKGVVMAQPYFTTKSLFGPKETLKIKIEKGVAHIEVIRE